MESFHIPYKHLFSNDDGCSPVCPFCTQDTGRNHEPSCPFHPDNQKLFEKPKIAHLLGWECPKCGSVYSPFVKECVSCVNSNVRIVSSGTQ